MGDTKTIAIYESDWRELEKMLGERRTFRQVIHELVLKEKKVKGGNDLNGIREEETGKED